MKYLYMRLFVAAALLSVSVEAFAQSGETTTLYPLYSTYKAGNVRSYVFKEETNIERTHSDSSTRNFKREITYFISQVAPKSPEDGFATVHTTIDSMIYRFSEGNSVVEYNSMRDKQPNLAFLDLLYSTIPHNRTFEMVISPYGDVAQVKGEMVDWLREYTAEKGKNVLAPIQKFLWLDGISDNNLKHYGDLAKGIIPHGNIARDSVWQTSVSFRMSSIDFSGMANTRISNVNKSSYRLEATADNLLAQPAETRVYGITEMVRLNSGRGSANLTIDLDEDRIRRAEIQGTSEINVTISKETFRDKISSNLSWTLTGQTQW